MTAIGVLRALRAAGRRVPADVSVIGCDDIAAASWVGPALTTVVQQKAEMGRIAVEYLAALDGRARAARRRRSSACPMRRSAIRESTGPALRPQAAGAPTS